MEKSLCTKVRPEMGQHADWEGLPESPIRASLITVLMEQASPHGNGEL